MRKNYKKSRKTNIKRLSGVVLSVLLVGGLIAGCGKSAGTGADITTETQTEVTTAAGNVSVKNNTKTTVVKGEKETTVPAVVEPATTAKESVTEAPKKPSAINNSTPTKQEVTTTAAVDNTPEDTPNVPEKPQHPKPVEKPTEKPTEKQTEAATEKPTETPKPQQTEAPTQAPVHVHSWAERIIGERIVVDKPAWDEQIEIFPERDELVRVEGSAHYACNECGGDPDSCGHFGNYHVEYDYETVHKPAEYRTVHHDAETHKENITETYCTGCGEVR